MEQNFLDIRKSLNQLNKENILNSSSIPIDLNKNLKKNPN